MVEYEIMSPQFKEETLEIVLSIVVFILLALGILFLAGKRIEKLVRERTSTPEQIEALVLKAEQKAFKKMLKKNAKNETEMYDDVDIDKAARLHQRRSGQ